MSSLASAGRPALRWTRALDHWVTAWRHFWVNTVVTSVLTPLAYVAALGVGLGRYVHTDGRTGVVGGVSYATFLVPGLLVATAMQLAVGESTWPVLASIKWRRIYHGMLATPLTVRDVLLGHFVFVVLRVSIGSVGFLAAAAALGYVHSVGGALIGLLAAVLTAPAFAAPVMAFSASLRNDLGLAVIFRFGVIPLFLFSGTFFPVSQLPGWLQPVAWVTPLWHSVSLARAGMLGHAGWAASLGHVAYLLGLTAVGLAAASRVFHDRLRT